MNGKSCRYCANNVTFTLEQALEKVKEKCGQTLEYVSGEYKNNASKLVFKCSLCNENHTYTLQRIIVGGLPCSNKTIVSPFRLTNDQFIKKAKGIHICTEGLPLYDYSKTNYVTSSSIVEIICKVHGSFFQVAREHTNNKRGCKHCGGIISKAEQDLSRYLENTLDSVTIIQSYRPKWLKGKEIDIYIPELSVGIEYNGTAYHHSSKNVSSFYDMTVKPETYHLDKFQKCIENGVKLIHIFEFEDLSIWKSTLAKLDKNTIVRFNNLKRDVGELTFFGISSIYEYTAEIK